MGGKLPGAKVTARIADVCGVPQGVMAQSPAVHEDIENAKDLSVKIHEFYTTLSALDNDVLDVDLGKSIVTRKCSICHNLERVFDASKNNEEWTATVGRMVVTMDDPDFLSEQEKADIITFLSMRELKE